ncbi:unnamed protein product, partial [marine sediment metagenome]
SGNRTSIETITLSYNLTPDVIFISNDTYSDINNIAKITPNELPIKPYDLLNFPGDYQVYNLTVISGKNNTLDINYPTNIDGISLSVDKSQINFTDAGVGFVALGAEINSNAAPGTRSFEINITSGVRLYDKVIVSIDVRLPE